MLLPLISKHKGPLAVASMLVALSVGMMSMPAGTLAGPRTTPTTAPDRCGVYSCVEERSVTTVPFGKWGTPVSQDDFNTALDSAKSWDVYNSPLNNTPRDPNNVKTDNGFLFLGGTYANGHLEGSGISAKYAQKYGRWEVRARADVGAGFSPTILLWPADDNWPTAGEIDLLESPHGNRQKAIAVVHNKSQGNFKTQGISGSQSDWHTYAVDWLPDHITFYVDDVEQWTVTDPKLIPTTSAMHLALQNDAGCGWIECPNRSTKPNTNMQVDWVRVYALPNS